MNYLIKNRLFKIFVPGLMVAANRFRHKFSNTKYAMCCGNNTLIKLKCHEKETLFDL